MKDKISLIGCGWLGLPLANHLIKKGCKLKGSTTSKDKLDLLKKHQIESFLIQLNETKISGNYHDFLAGSKTIIINVPPGLRKNPRKNHVAEINHLVSVIEKQNIKNVLYISSISVFNDDICFPEITDITPPNALSNGAMQLIEIEETLRNNPNFNTTILRFGGLVDKKRHPAKYLSGKTNIQNPKAPINLIHKEDCIQIITSILKNRLWNTSINAVYPDHPNKKTYYAAYCKHHNLPLPEFNTSIKSVGKIITNTKLVQLLNYSFEHTP